MALRGTLIEAVECAMSIARPTSCLLLALGAACGDSDDDSMLAATQRADTATAWFELQLQLVRDTPGFSPPVAARAFAYSGITLYESVVPGMPDHRSLVGTLPDLASLPQASADDLYDWSASANCAMAAITHAMFPTATADDAAAIDELQAQLAASDARRIGPDVRERSCAFGEAVASAIYDWSRTDGGDEGYAHNFPTSYIAPAGLGMWVPTPPMYSPALQPYWGQNRTFCLASTTDCSDGAPPAFSTLPGSEFWDQADEVYQTSLHLTPEQAEIARYWSDDAKTVTPPGHSISITTQVLEDSDASLALAAETYAKVGIAVSDAFVELWAVKFHFNVIRPVTYIRTTIDPSWMPLLVTPPFPEFPSGHSGQSGAAAEVLTAIFGETTFTDHTNDARGFAPRTFPSFDAFAEEAAISRLYGGIHYRAAIEDGLVLGQCVGQCVDAMPFE